MIRPFCRCAVLIGLLALAGCGKKAAAPPPPVPVSVAKVSLADVPQLVVATGTTEPIQSAQVQAQVSGQLIHVRFKEGDKVTAGQVLFEIDPRPFIAALAQAQSNLARDAAQVQSARNDVQRYQALAAKDYVTKQQLDQAEATANALTGTLGGDSAAITQARLNVQYATIRSPITGRAGSVLVKEGNQVRGGSGQTLVVINQIAPILVRFPVQASLFDAVRQRASKGLVVNVSPVGDSIHVEKGTLVFLDNAVDSNTGTVLLKAHFENTDAALWPGALESVSLQLDVQHNALVVPSSAVQSGQNGSVVWVVDSSRHAHTVKVGVIRSNDSLTIISGSIRPGEVVVTDGQLRLTDSAKVSIQQPRRSGADSTAASPVDTGTPKETRP